MAVLTRPISETKMTTFSSRTVTTLIDLVEIKLSCLDIRTGTTVRNSGC